MNDLEDLAQGPMDQNDIEILGSLREMWDAVDPLPEGLTDRIQFAMSVASSSRRKWRGLSRNRRH